MSDTGFEVVREAGDRVVVFATIVCDKAGRKVSRDRSTRRLIDRLHADLELRPYVFQDLDRQIAHAMGKTALSGGPRTASANADAFRRWRGCRCLPV